MNINPIRKLSIFLATGLTLLATPAYADLHNGRITNIAFGYDGTTIAFVISGWSRSNCACYSSWPNYMCLDRSRISFKEEFAWLLKARTLDHDINVNIDELSCKVIALYEAG